MRDLTLGVGFSCSSGPDGGFLSDPVAPFLEQTLLTYSLLLTLRTILTLSPLLWNPLTIVLFQLLHLLLRHLLSLLLNAIYGTLRTPGVLI